MNTKSLFRSSRPQGPSNTAKRTFLIPLACLLALPLAKAATPPESLPPAAPAAEEDLLIELPTFNVSTSKDVGYRAGNSVSATRIDTSIKDLPFSISAFTDQFITDIGAQDLNDIVGYAPGVTSGAKEFVAGNARYSIRGFDGDVAPQRNGFVGNRVVDSANITRVEVVKGPSSLLYGQITPGGSVNYITKRPTEKAFVSFRQTVGSDNAFRSVLDANTPLTDNLGTRLVVSYDQPSQWAETGESESWLFAPSAKAEFFDKKLYVIADYERMHRSETPLLGMMPNAQITGFSGAPSAANFPSPSAKSRAQAYFDVGAINKGFLAAPPHYREFNYVNNNDYRRMDYETMNVELGCKLGDHWLARANYNWNSREILNKLTGLAQWDVLPTAAYRSKTLSLFDYLDAYNKNPEAVLNDPTKTQSVTLAKRKRLQVSTNSTNTYQAEASGKYEFSKVKISPLFGAIRQTGVSTGYTRTAATAQFFPSWNYFKPETWDRTGDYDEHSLPMDSGGGPTFSREDAYYGVVTGTFFDDRAIVIGGARYDKVQSGGSKDYSYEAHKTMPQVGVGFHPTKDSLLFASYSESFLIEATSLTRPNPNYDPNKPLNVATNPNNIKDPAEPTLGKGYEVGLKTDFLSGRVSSTLSVFNLERSNRVLQIRQNVPGLSQTGTPSSQEITFNSQGTVDRSQGLELELTYSPLDNLQVYLTGAVMNIETIEFEAPPLRSATDPLVSGDYEAYKTAYNEAVQLIRGAVPEGSAEVLGSLWTRYTFNEGPVKGLWLGFGGNYTSKKAQRTANPELFFDPYFLVNAAIGYDIKAVGSSWSFNLNLKNLADVEYYPANQSRGLPLQYLLTVGVKF